MSVAEAPSAADAPADLNEDAEIAAAPPQPPKDPNRDYVIYEETADGIKQVGKQKAKTKDDAIWDFVEKPGSEQNARAVAAGAGEKIDGKAAKAPKLAAVSGGLDFESFSLKPVAKTERVKS